MRILKSNPLYLFAFALILVACSDKKPLPGERHSIFMSVSTITPDPEIQKEPVVLNPPQKTKNWSQINGNATHSVPPQVLNANLKNVWEADFGYGSNDRQRLISNLIVASGRIFGMDARGNIAAADAKTGEIKWARPTSPSGSIRQALGGGIAYDQGKLFIATSFGQIIAVQASDGKLLWQTPVMVPVRGAPTVKDGRVFVVTVNNETYALDAKTGKEIWSHRGITEVSSLLGTASPAVSGNVVVVTYSSGEVFALQAENGYPLWSDTVLSALHVNSASSIPHIHAQPVVYDGMVYIISHGGHMNAIDLTTGFQIWQNKIGGIHTPAVTGDFLFLINNQGKVMCLKRKTGQVRWIKDMPTTTDDVEKDPVFWAGPVLVNDQLVLTGSNKEVRFLSAKDGRLVNKLETSAAVYLSAVVADQTLYVYTDQADILAWR